MAKSSGPTKKAVGTHSDGSEWVAAPINKAVPPHPNKGERAATLKSETVQTHSNGGRKVTTPKAVSTHFNGGRRATTLKAVPPHLIALVEHQTAKPSTQTTAPQIKELLRPQHSPYLYTAAPLHEAPVLG